MARKCQGFLPVSLCRSLVWSCFYNALAICTRTMESITCCGHLLFQYVAQSTCRNPMCQTPLTGFQRTAGGVHPQDSDSNIHFRRQVCHIMSIFSELSGIFQKWFAFWSPSASLGTTREWNIELKSLERSRGSLHLQWPPSGETSSGHPWSNETR